MLGQHFQKMEHSLPRQEFFIHGPTSAYFGPLQPVHFLHLLECEKWLDGEYYFAFTIIVPPGWVL